MGDTQDDARNDVYATRRGELERAFGALPVAGTPDYWQRVEQTDGGPALPLEVLARCLRERYAAGAADAGARIFEVVVGRIQQTMRVWARHIAAQAHGSGRQQLQEDLEQECMVKVWQELTTEGPTFLLENFAHALRRIQQHVSHAVMEKASEWTRDSSVTPKRVPSGNIGSLQADAAREDETPLAERLADTTAEIDFARADLSDLLKLVEKLPMEQRELIIDRFYRDHSLEEMAGDRGVTTRTIYNRLKATLQLLGVRYAGGEAGGEEGHHGQH